ncbi:MAG: hypothetical protein AAF141_09425 [Pseudomonadota bacterium]
MEKIKGQAGKVGELIFAADTGTTYKKTIILTWAILRETGVLLWLVICLVFVGAEWFWQKSILLGQSARTWYEGLTEPSDAEPKSATEMGQSALSAVSTGAETLLYQAKKQLGIEAEPPVPKQPKVKATPKPDEPEVSSTATAAPAPPSIEALSSEADDTADDI